MLIRLQPHAGISIGQLRHSHVQRAGLTWLGLRPCMSSETASPQGAFAMPWGK